MTPIQTIIPLSATQRAAAYTVWNLKVSGNGLSRHWITWGDLMWRILLKMSCHCANNFFDCMNTSFLKQNVALSRVLQCLLYKRRRKKSSQGMKMKSIWFVACYQVGMVSPGVHGLCQPVSSRENMSLILRFLHRRRLIVSIRTSVTETWRAETCIPGGPSSFLAHWPVVTPHPAPDWEEFLNRYF